MRDTDALEAVDPHPNSFRITALYEDKDLDELIAAAKANGFHVHIFDLTQVLIPIPMPAGPHETYLTVCRGQSKGGAFG